VRNAKQKMSLPDLYYDTALKLSIGVMVHHVSVHAPPPKRPIVQLNICSFSVLDEPSSLHAFFSHVQIAAHNISNMDARRSEQSVVTSGVQAHETIVETILRLNQRAVIMMTCASPTMCFTRIKWEKLAEGQ